MQLSHYAKAVVAFVAPAAVSLIAAVTPGSDGGSTITNAELITAVCMCVVTAAGVYAVPNASRDTGAGDASTSRRSMPE